MDLGTLRENALLEYGRDWMGEEDPGFHIPTLTRLVNRAHRVLAEKAFVYQKTFTTNLTTGSSGVSAIAADTTVIDVDRHQVRAQISSTWRRLTYRAESELLDSYGPFEEVSNGSPLWYFTRTSTTASQHYEIVVVPGSDTAVTNGFKYQAWVQPSDLSADTDTPVMQTGLHDHIIPVTCHLMARLAASRGDAAAPVVYWEEQARQAMLETKRIVNRLRQGNTRRVHSDSYGGR